MELLGGTIVRENDLADTGAIHPLVGFERITISGGGRDCILRGHCDTMCALEDVGGSIVDEGSAAVATEKTMRIWQTR